ncbi:protein FAR1-RELATED SEQUENCE 2 isoform X2 [Ziziphus jujuba]|uniref:Protein FAR1-RELATED SEQUENCE n=1 Tax=Ziziphus jujuba TaxID=326968 RepID=A0A6P6G427_ZIZJJ|nr:protein FAR1-RELATED SEQUENCE 2 isoform X2 [Ziziphus jujuba]
MEIDLELPTCDREKIDVGSNINVDDVNTMRRNNVEEEHVNSSVPSENLEETHGSNANQIVSSDQDQLDVNIVKVDGLNKGSICEPCSGLEFESKEEAYSFYREYARSVGFGITIKASRRSKKSGKFIDIKIVCSRFGNKRESGATVNPRPCIKTDCKASMHMKRKENGKWVIHGFIKEHNHEICPDDFYYAIRGRNKQSAIVACEKKGLQLALDEGDVQIMLEHFMCMQEDNPNFFYALDLDHEKRLKSVFWVYAKGRHDYSKFYDVVFFDTFYVRNKYKIPFIPIVGVNNHFQYILLGCALVGEETKETFVWLMRTWLKAMGSQSPRVIITDQDKLFKEAVADVFPDARHCFCLWHVLRRIPENLGCMMNQNQNFMEKFNKCIYRSWTEEQFERKWWKMVDRFELTENEWFHSLYEDRKMWVPNYMKDTFLAGMSTTERSGSVTSFFDKYIFPETMFKEFIGRLYKEYLKDNCDMEATADFETRHKQPGLRSLSPFEKQMSSVYTEAIFKKFQVEVLGVGSCHLKKQSENEAAVIFQVDDFEKRQNFIVVWNEAERKICCLCHSFEYGGFLCRHALLVLQISGTANIPSHYILKRWTRDAKVNQTNIEIPKRLNFRFQRFNDLCKLAIKLGEEGSLSPEACHIALQALDEVLKQCVDVNNSVRSVLEPNMSAFPGFLNVEEKHGNSMGKSTKKKKTYRKRKSDPERTAGRMQESRQQMEQMNSRARNLDDCYIPQQDMQEVLGSRAPAIDDYYAAQDSIQGVGRLNSVSPIGDGYYCNQQGMQGQLHLASTRVGHYGTQQNMQGLLQGQPSFRVAAMHGCFNIQDNMQDVDQSVGSSHFRSIASKHLQDKHLSQ